MSETELLVAEICKLRSFIAESQYWELEERTPSWTSRQRREYVNKCLQEILGSGNWMSIIPYEREP